MKVQKHSVITMKITRTLTEGIEHIESLPIDHFIKTLSNMDSMVVQEKLDGAQLWVGVDEDGQLFTSREGKRANAERRYKPEDWPLIAAFNQFRAAHAAIMEKSQIIKQMLHPGDTVEAEVLFGRQPNSTIYGANGMSYIAFLRGVNGTSDDVAENLAHNLKNEQARVEIKTVDTSDGKDLQAQNTSVTFQFVSPHKLDSKKLKEHSGINKMLKKLEEYLKKSSGVGKYSNYDLVNTEMNAVPKEQKAEFKAAKQAVLDVLLNDYQLPIKNAILAKLSHKSGLAADDIKPNEHGGIEGIVLRDPNSGKQVKVVDRDTFTQINSFNQKPRAEIQSALNTTDPQASLESRGGLVGEMRIRFAETLGNRELAKASNARKIMLSLKKDNAEDTLDAFANSLSAAISDFQAVKKKILAIASETYQELDNKLEDFKKNRDNYKLKLKNGKEVQLSDETLHKTLLAFAEARKNVKTIFDKLKVCKTLIELLEVLYGNIANSIYQKNLNESILLEKNKRALEHVEISLKDYKNKTTYQLVNSYLATMFMTMLIYHTGDVIGMQFLRDKKNWRMNKHSVDMSPLNHWGYVIWRSANPDLEHYILPKSKAELMAATKHILEPSWKYMHQDFSYHNELDMHWAEYKKVLQRLMDLSGIKSKRVNNLLDLSIRFPKLDHDEQKQFIKKLVLYVRQFVPHSRLYIRTKNIQQNIGSEKMTKKPKLFEYIIKIAEDGETPSADGTNNSQTSVMTTTDAISPVQHNLLNNGRKTELRRRNTSKRFLALIRKHKDPRNYKDVK
jgi:hypothetical protein